MPNTKKSRNCIVLMLINNFKSFLIVVISYLGNIVIVYKKNQEFKNIYKNSFFILSTLIFNNNLHKI